MRVPGYTARLLGLVLASLPLHAWAGVSAVVDLGYNLSNTQTTDEANRTLETNASVFNQRYRLNLDQRLFPKLTFAAGGSLEQGLQWTGVSATAQGLARLWSFNTSLRLTDPIWSGGAEYSIRSQGNTQTLISEVPSLYLSWSPTDLPQTSLRLSSTQIHDPRRVEVDRTTNEASLGISWVPTKSVTLQYGALWGNPVDRISGVETQSFTQSARVSWMQRLFGDITTVATSFNASQRLSQILSAGTGGVTELFQAPVQGSSAIEALPATTTDITLAGNPALIDGNNTVTAGVNLGYSATLAGDNRPRHFGVEFTDPLTRVNRAYLYVDRELPPGIAGSFSWEAYRSDDNRLWTRVNVAGPVVFSELHDRFEIPLELVEGRYVKIVTRPLDPAITTDPRFSDVFVTELQLVRTEAVTTASDWQSLTDFIAMGAARTAITKELAHDLTLQVGAAGGAGIPTRESYTLSNGLTYARPLGKRFHLSARVARTDGNYGRGHIAAWIYNAAVTANVLPTWSHSLVYGGQVGTDAAGVTGSNSVSLLTRLAPLRGIGVLSNATYTIIDVPTGRRVHNELLMLGVTAQPHPKLTLAGSGAHTGTTSYNGTVERTRTNRLDASASFSPFPTLYLSGTASWTVSTTKPVLLANGTVAFSPFPDGALQMSVTYSQVLESSGAIGQYLSPAIRWTIRRGLLLTAGYTLYHSGATTPETSWQNFAANLQLVL